jgi:1-deoxy-D-xylulose-5-phosphate reductoisomerase
MQPKPIVILGSTGSIGRQTLDVVQALPERLRVVGLAAHSNLELFAEQVRQWQPEIAVLTDEATACAFESRRHELGFTGRFAVGHEGLEEIATWPTAELVLGAILGAAGLRPTLAAIRAGKDIAIANKETLVAAGEIVVAEAARYGVALLPVDSEHSAIAQCLVGEDSAAITRLTITASGGPFVATPRAELENVPPERALKHPTWAMGRKITIDSATLMNKGLEAIEARWLFDIPMESIDVVVHRQSIIHSMVTFVDGSVKAQLGVPDMRLPIQWALLHPTREWGPAPPLDLITMGPLTFERPDDERFPAIGLARHAMKLGGVAPAMMNAANEVAVQAFLDGKTNFYGITDGIASVLERCPTVERPGLDAIFEADAEARHLTEAYFSGRLEGTKQNSI